MVAQLPATPNQHRDQAAVARLEKGITPDIHGPWCDAKRLQLLPHVIAEMAALPIIEYQFSLVALHPRCLFFRHLHGQKDGAIGSLHQDRRGAAPGQFLDLLIELIDGLYSRIVDHLNDITRL